MKTVFFLIAVLLIALSAVFHGPILVRIGQALVLNETPVSADAIVVLNTGLEYPPRLIEAANLYRRGFAKKIVINGNRKMDIDRFLESRGFVPCCPWNENRLRILNIFGVPGKSVISLSLEVPHDTFSEAAAVAETLLNMKMTRILIVTSKTHTRRASHIWKGLYGNELSISMIAAAEDPFDPEAWWKDGRQVKWVLSEYGAWLYAFWKKISSITTGS